MSPAFAAFRLGLRRGWLLFRNNLKRADTAFSYVFWYGVPIAVMFFIGREPVAEGDPPAAWMFMPGVLALAIAVAASTPAFYLATEREDGTLLRAKAIPHGMIGYVTGMIVFACLDSLVGVVAITAAGLVLLSGVSFGGPVGLLLFVVVVVLGLTATLPFGIVIGSVIRNPRLVGGLSIGAIVVLAMFSGIFVPLQSFADWVQVIAQALPIYWIGLGMRNVFLPDEAMVLEIGQSWRQLEMLVALGIWTVIGFLVAPIVLRRMARRESGSALEERRQQVLQRLG